MVDTVDLILKDMVSLSTKVTEELKDALTKVTQEQGRTTSDFLRICAEEVVKGNLKLDGDRLVSTAEPIIIQQEPEDNFEYEELGFDTVLRMMRKKGYLDRQIRQMNENNASMISDMPNYNPRRAREDFGC